MSTIAPHYRTVKDLLQARSFSIDEYQREYKWDRENIEELLSDLATAFNNDYTPGDEPRKASDYGTYFLGSVIVTRRDNKSYIVDGQQRITSLTLLLIYLYRASKEQNLNVASTIEPLIYSDDYGQPKFNLDIAERVPVLAALFSGDEYSAEGKEESIRTIVARYHDIENLDIAHELEAGLETFIYWLINNVGMIEIATDSDVQAYSIFETMNDRGKPLSPVDMLKAYLLAPVQDEDDRGHANRVWKQTILELISWGDDPSQERDASFMKAWLRSQYADSIRERKKGAVDRDWELIGTTFHRWFRDNAGKIGVGTQAQNLELMTERVPFFARRYRTILEASRAYTPGLEPIFYNAHNDFTWQPTVLLAPLRIEDDEQTVRRKLAATATYLDIWMMRRTVNYIRIAYSSVAYAMFLLVRDIRGLNLEDLIDKLQDRLELDAQEVSFDGSPSRGRLGIKDLSLNQFSGRYIYHLLARITAYVEAQSGQPDRFAEYVDRKRANPLDIEHIWANIYEAHATECISVEDFRDWRDNVGGLVLLPADVNRSYQAKPFEEKSPHYAKQNLLASSLTPTAYEHQPQFTAFISRTGLPFRPYAQFNKAEQEERRELISRLTKLVWSPDRLEQYRSGPR